MRIEATNVGNGSPKEFDSSITKLKMNGVLGDIYIVLCAGNPYEGGS
jgi:hypothetical protein